MGKYVVFNRNCFLKMKDFSRLASLTLQAVTYIVKVVVSKNGARQTRFYYTPLTGSIIMAYRFVPFPMTLDDIKGHSPVAGLNQRQIDEHLCDILHGFNWHGASRGPSAIAELLVITENGASNPQTRSERHLLSLISILHTVLHKKFTHCFAYLGHASCMNRFYNLGKMLMTQYPSCCQIRKNGLHAVTRDLFFSEKLLDMQQMVSHKLDRMTNIKSTWEQKLTFARVIKQEASDGTG